MSNADLSSIEGQTFIQPDGAAPFEPEMITGSISDFVDGQQDCASGKPHRPGCSKAYDQGYGFQYEIEQIMGAMT